MNVVVLGASDNPERYSYKAVALLQEKKHRVFPVHPKVLEILGVKVSPSLKDIQEPIHTVSVYLSSAVSSALKEEIISCKPKRVIFNPGAENPELEKDLIASGITVLEACTLVMLSTGQF